MRSAPLYHMRTCESVEILEKRDVKYMPQDEEGKPRKTAKTLLGAGMAV